MSRLFANHSTEVHRDAVLRSADEEPIRKTVSGMAMQRAHTLRPMVVQGLAVAPVDSKANAPLERRANFEAGCEDDQIDRVFDAVGHYSALGNPLDAVTITRVDQRYVGTVEGG